MPGMPRLRGRFSIATLATTATLVPLLVAGLLLIGISTRSGRRLSEELGAEMLAQTVDRVGGSVDRYLGSVARLSDLLANSVEHGAIRAENMNSWQARINVCLDVDPGIASIGYVDVPSSQYIYIARFGGQREVGHFGGPVEPGKLETFILDDDGHPDPSTRRVLDYTIQNRPWYRQAIAMREPAWTDTYDWILGSWPGNSGPAVRGIAYAHVIRTLATARPVSQPTTTTATSTTAATRPARAFPVPADPSVRGVLSIDLSLGRVDQYLAQIAAPLGASLIVSDVNGHVVASSDPNVSSAWPVETSGAGPVERALADHLQRDGRQIFARPNVRAMPVQLAIDGKTFWVTELPLPVSSGATWRLLVAIPEQPILLRAKADIRHSIWIGTGYVALAAITAVALARFLARPFRRLAVFATQIGQGQFDQRIEGAQTHEVAELSNALNGMARALRERVAMQSAKEVAESAGAAKARLIAHVSHEFRTPLNAIVGYAELIRDEARAQDRTRDADDAANILLASGHLLTMVENLLDLSRADAGRLPMNFVEFAVHDLIDSVVRTIRPLLKRNENELNVVEPDVALRMASDPDRLRQVLINLLSNACKFTEGGVIDVAVRLDESGSGSPAIVFEITDTGIGMDPNQVHHAFEPFVQFQREGPGRSFEGAGLGLAITRHLCELLGGTILLTSERGRGTRATVRIPQAFVGSNR